MPRRGVAGGGSGRLLSFLQLRHRLVPQRGVMLRRSVAGGGSGLLSFLQLRHRLRLSGQVDDRTAGVIAATRPDHVA